MLIVELHNKYLFCTINKSNEISIKNISAGEGFRLQVQISFLLIKIYLKIPRRAHIAKVKNSLNSKIYFAIIERSQSATFSA